MYTFAEWAWQFSADSCLNLLLYNFASISYIIPFLFLVFLEYENEIQVGRQLMECQVTPGFQKDKERACRVDLDRVLGKECTKEKDFGYEQGEPCILLKMNRVSWLI